MKQKYFLELTVQDEGTFVKALLSNGDKLILDYENEQVKQVRVRAPLPDREGFIERSECWVKNGFYKTIEESVNSYIKSREKEVFEQIQEIRKSMKRINKSMQCVNIASEELEKYQNKKT